MERLARAPQTKLQRRGLIINGPSIRRKMKTRATETARLLDSTQYLHPLPHRGHEGQRRAVQHPARWTGNLLKRRMSVAKTSNDSCDVKHVPNVFPNGLSRNHVDELYSHPSLRLHAKKTTHEVLGESRQVHRKGSKHVGRLEGSFLVQEQTGCSMVKSSHLETMRSYSRPSTREGKLKDAVKVTLYEELK